MRRHSIKATAVGLIAATSMCLIFASSAQAQSLGANSLTKFQKAQEALEHQIIARQVQLALLGTEVANAANVTTSDRGQLVMLITTDQKGLATDFNNAALATKSSDLNPIRQAVVGGERVYAVVTAEVGLVIGADNATVAEGGYSGLSTELAPFVTELGSTHATNLLADITSRVTAAEALTTGLSADALALSPSGYPGNESQIKSYNFQLGQVGHDLGIAKSDVKTIETIALNTPRIVKHV